jgi:hypothetical protein
MFEKRKCKFRRHKCITQGAIREQYETESLAILPGSCQWLCFVHNIKVKVALSIKMLILFN